MVVEESAQYQPEYIQLLTGDFNTRFDSKVFESVRNAGWEESYETIHGEKKPALPGMSSREPLMKKVLRKEGSILSGTGEQ